MPNRKRSGMTPRSLTCASNDMRYFLLRRVILEEKQFCLGEETEVISVLNLSCL